MYTFVFGVVFEFTLVVTLTYTHLHSTIYTHGQTPIQSPMDLLKIENASTMDKACINRQASTYVYMHAHVHPLNVYTSAMK